ncbi:tRNA adenosine(34) deaminase TadA [bacterium]
MNLHEIWMQMALKEAEQAFHQGEVPVGAVIVQEDRVIGKGYNQIETLQDPTAHAEMIAISAAANTLQSWRLDHCSLYVTLEPCAMCAGAIVLARIETLIFGAQDHKAGACGTLRNVVQDSRLNHHVHVVPGILSNQSASILKSFFQNLRQLKLDQRNHLN